MSNLASPLRAGLTVAAEYPGPFPRARHAHRCGRCGQGRSVYCYKTQCRQLRDIPNCAFCRR